MNGIVHICRDSLALLLAALTLLLTAACKPKRYEVITRITPAGHFHRQIYRPVDESLPPEALSVGKPDPAASQPADYKLARPWRNAWQSCQDVAAPKDAWEGKHLKAAGEFATADDIPCSYHLQLPNIKDRASTNQIRHDYQDYVLFGIDSWEETITETVRLDEYVEALDKLIAATLPAIEATLDELLGEEYDLSAFHQFLRAEAATAYRRYCLAVYQHGAGRGEHSEPVDWKHLKEILAGIGFDLPLDENGKPADTDNTKERLERYLVKLFQERIVLKSSGNKLTADQAKQLLERIERYTENGESDSEEEAADEDETPVFTDVLNRHLRRIHGEDYEDRFKTLMARMSGAHGNGPLLITAIFPDDRQFDYSLEAAGPILETNGKRTGICTVRWTFSKSQLFPNGYTMRARSIRRKVEVEKRLFGKAVLDDVARVFPLLECIPVEGPARDALKAAVNRGSLEPVEALLESSDEVQRESARTILDLRGQPPRSRPR